MKDLRILLKKAMLTLLMSMLCTVAFFYFFSISGTVKDTSGEPIIGANVTVKGTTNGTITDINGLFKLGEVNSRAVIVVSFIGYTTQEISVGQQRSFTIVMKEDTKTLDEVVVVGYGTMKKSDLTGSVSSLNSEHFQVGSGLTAEQVMKGAF